MSSKSRQNEINHQDVVNNNHIGTLEEKAKSLAISTKEPSSLSKEVFLFDPKMLLDLKPDSFQFQYDKYERSDKSKWSIDLGDELYLRPLKRDDFARGYMDLLSQLTEVGQVSREQFERRFDEMRSAANTYYICVVEDAAKSKLVASLTLVFEQKFIREASSRGRFEDLVVDVGYRGKRLSKLLLDVVVQLSKRLGCYKISLECKDHLRKHYEQFGFVLEQGQNYLCRRFI